MPVPTFSILSGKIHLQLSLGSEPEDALLATLKLDTADFLQLSLGSEPEDAGPRTSRPERIDDPSIEPRVRARGWPEHPSPMAPS